MRLLAPHASVLAPDGAPLERALARVETLAVGAHADDVEILALSAILDARALGSRGFAAVVCADGAGSPRAGAFANISDDAMKALRIDEQRRAAKLGDYGLCVQLGLPSATIKDAETSPLAADLATLLLATRPREVITHALTDRHDTHVAVALAVVAAARRLPPDARPARVLGAEVWRSLDWLADRDRVRLPIADPDDLGERLVAVHASQVAGGKRYDRAARGRRQANATFDEPRRADAHNEVVLATDLSPLVHDAALTPEVFLRRQIDAFAAEALSVLQRLDAARHVRRQD